MAKAFREVLTQVEPILFKEPLAGTLGALTSEDNVIEYTFIDTVKMAGHACPTVAAAYLCCQLALERLYPDAVPVRGEVAVTVHGEPDEGVFGVMGQVFSFLTGAAPHSGFRGLGHKFRRKDLLRFEPGGSEPGAICFEFERSDTHEAVLVTYRPGLVPVPAGGERMARLLEKVVWDAARDEERKEFQDLWMERVQLMVAERRDIDQWITIETRRI